MPKPQVFIGSSAEGRDIAYAIQVNLRDDADCTVWTQGVFPLSGFTLESLLSAAGRYDFALFVLSNDDLVNFRGNLVLAARDNVLLEIGLFLGVLPRQQVLLLTPETSVDGPPFKLPSDLAALGVGSYNSARSDGNWTAATGVFCGQVRAQMQQWRTRALTALDEGDENRDIRGMVTVRERFSWGPDSVPEPVNRIQYLPQPGELKIRGDKAEATAKMVSRGMIDFDGVLTAHGVFHTGVAYMVYTAVDEHRGYRFKGLLFLRVPPFGPMSGLWMSEDDIDQTRRGVVIGDVSIQRNLMICRGSLRLLITEL